MQKIIVLAVSSWEIETEKKSGLSVNYIDPSLVQNDTTIGIRPLKANFESEDIRKFPIVPGVYQADFGMKPNSKGKIEMALNDVTYLNDYVFIVD